MRLAIIGSGDYADWSTVLSTYDYIIAADGGADYCARWHSTPHKIIGDGDSSTISFTVDRDQHTTDLQKALRYATTVLTADSSIDLFCVTSQNRTDHTLAAITTLLYWPNVQAIYTPYQILYAPQPAVHLPQASGTAVSIVPYTATATVSLAGLQWSGTVTLDSMRSGISNRITQSPASITVTSGRVIVSLDHTYGN
ncbi:MAG: thiamine pyrophosphokinase [Candidatus Kerfeldbacteria bacterium]|nr:thiamine pyrophosphokinase [Candidatus Kerfeldbacteria bacterium]